MAFQGDLGVTPDLVPHQVEGKLVGSPAVVTTIPRALKPTLEVLRPKLWSLETELRVHGIHGRLETG